MDIFRFEKNVPDVYVKESRDFQVLLRLLTYAISAGKNNADALKHLNNPQLVNSNLLSLLQQKAGFFTELTFQDLQIRDVISGFQDVVRNKGNIQGIQDAIALFFNAMNVDGTAIVYWYNNTNTNERYYIDIGIAAEVENFDLLREILKYVVPFGYKLNIFFYTYDQIDEIIPYTDSINWDISYVGDNNGSILIRSHNNASDGTSDSINYNEHPLLGRVDTMALIKKSESEVTEENNEQSD